MLTEKSWEALYAALDLAIQDQEHYKRHGDAEENCGDKFPEWEERLETFYHLQEFFSSEKPLNDMKLALGLAIEKRKSDLRGDHPDEERFQELQADLSAFEKLKEGGLE